ncbi:MAG TPA: DUF3592 domain-containing protein [Myxococcaceae bacterium]|jgi:hypothetical protein
MARPSFEIKNPTGALVFGSVVLLGAAWWMLVAVLFAVSAERVTGQVTNTYSCRTRRRTSLCGDVSFTARDGRQGVLRDARGIGRTGSQEEVLYNPDNLDDVRQAGLFKMWAGPVIAMVLGGLFFGSGLQKFLRARG